MAQVPCYLSHVIEEEQKDSQVMFLHELQGSRWLPMDIGPMEAKAIKFAMKGQEFMRPLTHDLLAKLIGETGHNCREVRVVDLRDRTFFAELVLEGEDGQEHVVDCRPSDGVALHLRVPDCQLTIADEVFEAAASED